MCGIIVYRDRPDSCTDMYKLLDSLEHRGPDERGYCKEGLFNFGHTRLCILDLENGQQPFESDNLIIVFNGEIYNHDILRQGLKQEGYIFSTRSDTEVIAKLYHAYGDAAFDKLSGMYAIVIFDKHTGEVTFVRDNLGIKPLLYYYNNDQLIIASEAKVIVQALQMDDVEICIDSDAIRKYFVSGYSGAGIVSGLETVKKGVIYRYTEGKILQIQAVNFNFPENDSSLEELLIEELTEQLDADVDVGLLLSGGVDSSILAALASYIKPKISTYTIGYLERGRFDESEYAMRVSNRLSTDHREFIVSEGDLLDFVPDLIQALDTPLFDPAMLPLLFLCERISHKHKVVISGDGGDELFCGYQHHRVLKYSRLFNTISKFLSGINCLSKYKKIIDELLNHHPNNVGPFSSSRGFINGLDDTKTTMMSLNQAVKNDIDIGLDNILLRKTDLCSMRYGVEVRVPYLSKRLYSYSEKRDNRDNVNILFGKKPLRSLLRKHLGIGTTYRRKMGFRVPLNDWVARGELGKQIDQVLLEDNVIPRDVISVHSTRTMLNNKAKYSHELFSMYLLNKWIINIAGMNAK